MKWIVLVLLVFIAWNVWAMRLEVHENLRRNHEHLHELLGIGEKP